MAATVHTLAVSAARPEIELDGTRRPALASALLSMRLSDAVDDMAAAEFSFGAWGGTAQGLQFMDRRLVDFGKPLKVTLRDGTLFEGRITALAAEFAEDAPPRLRVLAEDRLQGLRMSRRSRVFERMSPGQILRRIASDHSLQTSIAAEGETLAVSAQLNQSDLAFLHGLARANDLELWAEGDTLHLAAARDGDPLELRHAGTLRRFEVSADLAHQRSAIVASGWDVSQRRAVSHRATDTTVRSELGNDESGAALLASALGERVDTLAHRSAAGTAEARAMAEAAYRIAARRFVTGSGTAVTDAALRPGGRVRLLGLGPLFSGEYRLTAIVHRFDGVNGLMTDFNCERAGLGRP